MIEELEALTSKPFDLYRGSSPKWEGGLNQYWVFRQHYQERGIKTSIVFKAKTFEGIVKKAITYLKKQS